MTYRTLRRLLLTGCLLAALGSWWFSCAFHVNAVLSTPVFSFHSMVHASGISFMQPPRDTTPRGGYLSHLPVNKVVWYNPVGRFRAGRNIQSGHWYVVVPLWFPWFLTAGFGWLFLRRLEKRKDAAMENRLARDHLEKTPSRPPE